MADARDEATEDARQTHTGARLVRKADELRVLDELSTELNSVLEPGRILTVVLDSMQAIFGVQRCRIYLHETGDRATRGELVLAASRVADEDSCGRPLWPAGDRIRVGRGMVGAAAAKRAIVRLNFKPNALPSDPDSPIASRMAIPMLAKGELVGVLLVENLGEDLLRKGDEHLVTIVANHAAVALQNARLYAGVQQLNAELEARVEARTAELAAKNRELQETQAQLVQSGKLAALGELAAGLSHEMNTPLGALSAGVDVTRRVTALLREAGLREPPPEGAAPSGVSDPGNPEAPTGAPGASSALLRSLDAGVSRRLLRALSAMEDANRASRDACARVFSIFATLRSFARLDEAALQPVDLNAGIDSALGLLTHRLGERITVERAYGALPQVRCYAGEINQVFLIVLTNAVDAIAGAGTITLRTRAQGDHVVAEIEDTGAGIARDHLERIFDPGFTTKGVGVGTGLSLGIAYRIMEKHAGGIRVDSTQGQGTRVSLHLPVAR